MQSNDSRNYKTSISPAADALMSACALRDIIRESEQKSESELDSELAECVQLFADKIPEDLLKGDKYYQSVNLESIARRLIELGIHDETLTHELNDLFEQLTGIDLLKAVPPKVVFYELPGAANG